ncbi:MAG: hypothetical protein ACE5K9_06060 [Candidatus Methylomirabilales bacterium]
MLRDFWSLFSSLVLVSMALVLANYESVVAKHDGFLQKLSPLLISDSDLRDFLPKAGSTYRYEGTIVYRDGTKSKFTRTVQLDWRREKGRDYLVRTSKDEERASFGLRLTDVTKMYEVASAHVAVVSIDVTRRGIPQVKFKFRNDPPLVSLQWPLREGEKWEQTILVTTEKDDGPSTTQTLNVSSVVRGKETIHTSAGKFSAWRIEGTIGKVQFTSWWANGWIIKWQNDGPPKIESGELVEFKEPGR